MQGLPTNQELIAEIRVFEIKTTKIIQYMKLSNTGNYSLLWQPDKHATWGSLTKYGIIKRWECFLVFRKREMPSHLRCFGYIFRQEQIGAVPTAHKIIDPKKESAELKGGNPNRLQTWSGNPQLQDMSLMLYGNRTVMFQRYWSKTSITRILICIGKKHTHILIFCYIFG